MFLRMSWESGRGGTFFNTTAPTAPSKDTNQTLTASRPEYKQCKQTITYAERTKYTNLIISHFILKFLHFQIKGTLFLPLHPQTSTSLLVWVQASSQDVVELFLHHSCSREAKDNHKKNQLIIMLLKTNRYIKKKRHIYEGPCFLCYDT